jgi:5-methylcytosine-specific restriction endonuclease McrBC regulatory subunit McrC
LIRRAVEDRISWFDDLGLAEFPYPLPKSLKIHFRGKQIGVEPQGIVGALPLRNGDTLHLVPKIDKINFLRLLFKAEGAQRDLQKAYDDFVSYFVDEEASIDRLVARQMFLSAAEIMSQGLEVERVREERTSPFAYGQINVVRTALRIGQRKPDPVCSRILKRTNDIAENRLITVALVRAWSLLNEMDRQQLASIYHRWLKRFTVTGDIEADISLVTRRFAQVGYGGPRGYYRKALMFAMIILGSNGLGFAYGRVVTADAVLINTAAVFEKYVRNTISEKYSDRGFVVTKGTDYIGSLYTDGSFGIEPDILIAKDRAIRLLADVKYKIPTAADHYQMLSYLQVTGVRSGLLIAPLFVGEQAKVVEYVTATRLIVREIFLPVDNLSLTEETLGHIVERFSI